MALAAAVATVEAAIALIPAGGLANGTIYVNTAMPSTSHIRDHLKWPITATGDARSLSDHVCRYAKVHLSEAARNAEADKSEVDVAVIVAIARTAAWRYYGWERASLNLAECEVLPAGTAELVVHADHAASVIAALREWAAPASRFMALFYYNALSYETSNHHHLPAVTKKLARTTIQMAGMTDWIAGNETREGSVFHDMFHPVSDTEKSNAARRVSAKDHLSALKFDNLRKRIPVKAPDSGIAINYDTLYIRATEYEHVDEDLPAELQTPAALIAAVQAYEVATTADELRISVGILRVMSMALEEPSAYMAGFILGREARATNDVDLDLRTAARHTTILGSPAYARAAADHSGAFAAGKAAGYRKLPDGHESMVLPRVTAAVATVATLFPAAAPLP